MRVSKKLEISFVSRFPSLVSLFPFTTEVTESTEVSMFFLRLSSANGACPELVSGRSLRCKTTCSTVSNQRQEKRSPTLISR